MFQMEHAPKVRKSAEIGNETPVNLHKMSKTINEMEAKSKSDWKRYIKVTPAQKKYLALLWNVTERFVDKALNFESQSKTSRKIRRSALTRGGEQRVDAPECETIHTWDGKMAQVFKNGAILTITWDTGEWVINHEDVDIEKGVLPFTPEIAWLQQKAAAIK